MAQDPINVNEITNIYSYLASVDWEEKWLWCLILFQLVAGVTTGAMVFMNKMHLQAVIFCVYLLIISSAEYINEWAARNYKLYSKQQYFDSNGMFISIVLSAPLLINSLVIVIAWVWQTWNMMFTVKKAQLRHKAALNKKKTS